MKEIYTSDQHRQTHLYQKPLNLPKPRSAQFVVLGGDLLPSSPDTKRFEDVIPHQQVFIDRFMIPYFIDMFEITEVEKIFLISGKMKKRSSGKFREPQADKSWPRFPTNFNSGLSMT